MNPIKILIVDDEVISSMYWANRLSKLNNVTVKTCTTGEKAIELAKNDNPDIIIMDLRLAGKLDGIDTANLITSFSDPRFIFVTGYMDEDLINKLSQVKNVDYLLKPIAIKDLINVFNKWGIMIQDELVNS